MRARGCAAHPDAKSALDPNAHIYTPLRFKPAASYGLLAQLLRQHLLAHHSVRVVGTSLHLHKHPRNLSRISNAREYYIGALGAADLELPASATGSHGKRKRLATKHDVCYTC